MKHSGIPLKGYRLDTKGKLIRTEKGMSVSKKIQRAKSTKVKVKRGA